MAGRRRQISVIDGTIFTKIVQSEEDLELEFLKLKLFENFFPVKLFENDWKIQSFEILDSCFAI